MKRQEIRLTVKFENNNNKIETANIKITGPSKMTIAYQDLILKVAISLLDSINYKTFHDQGIQIDYYELIEKLQESVSYLTEDNNDTTII